MLPDQDPRSENHHSKETFFFFFGHNFLNTNIWLRHVEINLYLGEWNVVFQGILETFQTEIIFIMFHNIKLTDHN